MPDSPKPRPRAHEIFATVFAMNPSERNGRLDELCSNDPELRATVEELLADYDHPASFIAEVETAARNTSPNLPKQIGAYRITGILGRGGMGIVYSAEQERPRRRVALKVLPLEAADDEIRRRFEHEAEILGLLQHPGIARIYDAGTHDLGFGEVPFFAMELVEGLPLTDYADREQLSIESRCQLVAKICDAIQFAHERGVVHRDLKPANILCANGQPKILDFGIARSTNSDLQLPTLNTRTGQLLGTLAYMSPEQIVGNPDAIAPCCDVYSVGVLLYQLLVGRLPIDLSDTSLPQACQLIQDREPMHISRFNRLLRGDLETIVNKALVKEQSLRYASIAALAEDLRRFLRNEPIAARPITTFYQIRKFAARNRALVGGTLTTILALIVGIIGISVLAANNQALAEAERQKSEMWRQSTYRAQMRLTGVDLEAVGGVDRMRKSLQESKPATGQSDLRDWEWYLAWSHCHQESRIVSCDGHPHDVTWIGDGKRIAVQHDPGTSIFHASSGAQIHRFPRLATATPSFDRPHSYTHVDPGGRRVAATLSPGRVRVHDLASGTTIREFAVPGHQWRRPVLSHDGRRLALSAVERGHWIFQIWNVDDGTPVARLTGDPCRASAFSPDGRFFGIALTRGSHRVKVWRWDQWDQPLHRLSGPSQRMWGLCFSPDSKRVAGCGAKGILQVWDVGTGDQLHSIQIQAPLRRLAWSPNGRVLAAACEDYGIYLFDLETGNRRRLTGHSGPVWAVAWRADSQQLASVSADQTLRTWNLERRPTLHHLQIPGRARREPELAWSLDGRELAARYGYLQRVTWNLSDTKQRSEWTTRAAAGHIGARVGERPGTVLFGGLDARGRLVEPRTLVAGTMQRIALNPVHPQLAIGGSDLLRIWNLDAGPEPTWSAHMEGKTLAVAWHPNGQTIAWIDTKGVVRVHDGAKGKLLHSRRFAGGHGLDYAPDGARLAIAANHELVLWHIERNELEEWPGHTQQVRTVAWHPDGRRIASGGSDATVRIWDVESRAGLLSLRMDSEVLHVKWSLDGTALAAVSASGAVKIWDASEGYRRDQ